jgi:DinB superfamily
MAIMRKICIAVLALLTIPALAQSTIPPSTIKDALVKHWKTSGDFTIAVAKLMPAESYTFKPVPDELTFGQVLIQVGRANLGACALASGTKRPDVAPALVEEESGKQAPEKDSIVQFLSSSFDFCNQAVAGMTPEKLGAVVGPPNRKMTAFEWLWAYFTHTAHHRGQLEVYLRLKGIKPPEYVF